jgi:hypothetical protein
MKLHIDNEFNSNVTPCSTAQKVMFMFGRSAGLEGPTIYGTRNPNLSPEQKKSHTKLQLDQLWCTGQNAGHYHKRMNKIWMWFSRKYLLRKIYGPVWDWSIWRNRYNFELYQLYKQTKLIPAVKISGIRWDGHVQRTEEKQMDNRLLMQKSMSNKKEDDQNQDVWMKLMET